MHPFRIILFLQFKVVDQLAETDFVKLVVLIFEMLASFTFALISISKSSQLRGDNLFFLSGSGLAEMNGTGGPQDMSQVGRGEGVASMVIFSIAVVVYIVVVCLCIIIPALYQEILSVVAILTAVGGMFYLIGDNLPPLVREYGEQLGCNQTCVEQTESAGLIMLALAAFFYLPIVISGKFEIRWKDPDKSLKTPGSVAALLLLSKLTDLDLVYTLIERIASGVCPHESTVTAAWVYYGIFVLTFLVFSLLAINFYMYQRDEAPHYEKCTDISLANINSVLVCVCLAGYLLADNMLPLACTGLLRNDAYYRDVVKLSLWAPTILIASVGLLVSVVCKCYGSVDGNSYPV